MDERRKAILLAKSELLDRYWICFADKGNDLRCHIDEEPDHTPQAEGQLEAYDELCSWLHDALKAITKELADG